MLNNKRISAGELAVQIDAELFGDAKTEIGDISHDSRQVANGSLFAAVEGLTTDGHRFVDDVMRRGAAGIISQREPDEDFSGVWLRVADTRHAMALAASAVHGDPSSRINLVGITGTNGKTTTTYLVNAVSKSSGVKTAMLTTVEYRIGDESRPAVRTTPEATDTFRFLADAVGAESGMAVMEASSQAIDLNRCDGLKFRVAVFTNLTRDHLDYHHTMENYYAAKRKLFDGGLGQPPTSSIINIDDEWGRRLVGELRSKGQRVVTISQLEDADVASRGISVSMLEGTSFKALTPAGEVEIRSPLVGRPHVYNMLCAIAVGLELGYEIESIAKGFSDCQGAPGRFERVIHDGDFAVVVDYAHTDDALLNTLKTAKELAEGRVITVFGCGGDRDKTKREPMGKIAAEFSDFAIITSDNPRTEDPLAIISEIEKGFAGSPCEYIVEPDRREAIFSAVRSAGSNDVVIIAGKGHETYQIVGGDKFHFDDKEIALEAIDAKERF
ncbi:MAG: UDP-N-acetylmuramoyl-L-alanyl-D-glutamate--2,6-diaminopimelate ligase [Pyrinomonadaceae bacterium]